MAVRKFAPCWRRYASQSRMPASFATAYASLVGSTGPVHSDEALNGCGAAFGYTHELAR